MTIKEEIKSALRSLKASDMIDRDTIEHLSESDLELLTSLHEEGWADEVLALFEEVHEEEEWQAIKSRLDQIEKRPTRLWSNVIKYAAVFLALLGIGHYMLSDSPVNTEASQGQSAVRLDLGGGETEILGHNDQRQIVAENGKVLGQQKGNTISYRNSDQIGAPRYHELEVPYGSIFNVELSDGTVVHLNSGTRMRYPVRFSGDGNREIVIHGEAYFKVAKDKAHPFIVHADEVAVEVLGTEFNVSTLSEGVDVEAVLVEGSVAIYENGHKEGEQLMTPGHKAEWHKKTNRISISPTNTRLYTSWLTGELIFKNAGMGTIIPKLERSYNVSIHCNLEEFEDKRYDASFQVDKETIAEVMHHLSRVAPIDYDIQGSEIRISKQLKDAD